MPDRQHDDEPRLIEQAKKGDPAAFGQLYEFYAPRVFRFLFAHLNCRQDAEDLTEEVFLRVWEALPGFRLHGAPFGGYLFRVARNALYDFYRRNRHGVSNADTDYDWIDEQQPDPADSVPLKLQRRQIQRMLAQLRADYRMVVTMRFLVGLTTEETATAMGRSSGAVRVLQHRALESLRELIEKQNRVLGSNSEIEPVF